MLLIFYKKESKIIEWIYQKSSDMLKSQKISAYKIHLFAYSLGGNRVARYPSEKLPFILGVYTLMTKWYRTQNNEWIQPKGMFIKREESSQNGSIYTINNMYNKHIKIRYIIRNFCNKVNKTNHENVSRKCQS